MTNHTPWPGQPGPSQQPYRHPNPNAHYAGPTTPNQTYGAPPQGYSPYGAPLPPPPLAGPPPRKNRKRLLLTIGAVTVALVTVTVLTVTFVGGHGNDRPPAPPVATGDPVAVVQGYLAALARGDAKSALALGASQPGSSDWLNDDVLKKQLAKLPITDIQVSGVTPGKDADHLTVNASAKFGDHLSDGKINMVRRDGGWKLKNAFADVGTNANASPDNADTVLRIFGKPLDKAGHFYIFPGYIEASGTPYLGVDQPDPLGLGDLKFDFIDFKFSMTDAGRKAAEDTVRTWFTKCWGPGPKTGQCAKKYFHDVDFDPTTTHLTAPLDLSKLRYMYNSGIRSVFVVGDVGDFPFTVTNNAGQTVALIGSTTINESVDLGNDPPTLVEPN